MELEKVTAERRRWYDDACAAAHALDLLGERWALLVVRELFFGPKRFSDLRAGLPGISANVLTQRLEGLEGSGILKKTRLPPPASVSVYELTEWGLESEPIFQALGRWAVRSPLHDPTLSFSANSLMLSFRTMFDPARAGDLKARIAFRIGGECFLAAIADGAIEARRVDEADGDVLFTGPAATIGAFVHGGAPAEALPDLEIAGDAALARRFATLFPLPPKLPAVA